MKSEREPRKRKRGKRSPLKTLRLTDSEWAILKAVWELEPCAAPAIREALSEKTGWTYSTVKTLMDRMVEKGLLKTERVRNLILYRSTVTVAQARRAEILRTVKQAFDGALRPMLHFLLENSKLSAEELDALEELIRKKRAKRR